LTEQSAGGQPEDLCECLRACVAHSGHITAGRASKRAANGACVNLAACHALIAASMPSPTVSVGPGTNSASTTPAPATGCGPFPGPAGRHPPTSPVLAAAISPQAVRMSNSGWS
jgi:hypothetical protein